jgi:hypothetical protein
MFNTFMTQGDLETFYPFQMGVGKGAPNNFESSYDEDSDPDLDDRNDDQDNTDYEDEALGEGDIEQTKQLPCFRQLVREKKKQLKDTYGKGKISIGECGIQPIRTESKYNPQVRIPKVYSPFKDCGLNPDLRPGLFKVPCVCTKSDCDCRIGKNCCQYNRQKESEKAQAWSEYTACRNEQGKLLNPGLENEDAWARAQDRFNADNDAWRRCRDVNKGIWTPGWRRQWRKFKKSGGLKTIKQESTRCLFGNPISGEPIIAPTPVVVAPTKSSSLPKFGNVLYGGNVVKKVDVSKDLVGDSSDLGEDSSNTSKSKYYIIIVVVLVIAIAGFLMYRKYKK